MIQSRKKIESYIPTNPFEMCVPSKSMNSETPVHDSLSVVRKWSTASRVNPSVVFQVGDSEYGRFASTVIPGDMCQWSPPPTFEILHSSRVPTVRSEWTRHIAKVINRHTMNDWDVIASSKFSIPPNCLKRVNMVVARSWREDERLGWPWGSARA